MLRQTGTSTFGRRVDGPQGRRRATREAIRLPAAVDSVRWSARAILMDISSTGARLRGDSLPEEGNQLFLKAAGLSIFGKVTWQRNGECGILFDDPIGAAEIMCLKLERRRLQLLDMSVEEQQAAQDWATGFAR